MEELLSKWEEMGYTFRPLSDLTKAKTVVEKDSFPYGCCPFSYALLLLFLALKPSQSEPSPGWIEITAV